MNRDDIIRMAREAGLEKYHLPDSMMEYEFDRCIERFAAIVSDRMIRNGYRKCAQGQRETQFCSQLEAAVAGAVAAEREACAQLCEQYDDDGGAGETWGPRFADAIRARGSND